MLAGCWCAIIRVGNRHLWGRTGQIYLTNTTGFLTFDRISPSCKLDSHILLQHQDSPNLLDVHPEEPRRPASPLGGCLPHPHQVPRYPAAPSLVLQQPDAKSLWIRGLNWNYQQEKGGYLKIFVGILLYPAPCIESLPTFTHLPNNIAVLEPMVNIL